MSLIFEDLKKFLKKINLTNYEINAYFSLLKSDNLTAREISTKSRIPNGRIYDVLTSLHDYGLVDVQVTRPKKYKAINPNIALKTLITKKDEERQEETKVLFQEAVELEKRIVEARLLGINPSNRVFWSTAYGIQSIIRLYQTRMQDLREEFLLTGFITEDTLKVLHLANKIYSGLKSLISKGGQVKFLWSFDFDERSLTNLEKQKNDVIMQEVEQQMKSAFLISSSDPGFEMKYIYSRLTSYFDLFDRREIVFKFRNPLSPSQISSCLSVIDPNLTAEFRDYFFKIWERRAVDLKK